MCTEEIVGASNPLHLSILYDPLLLHLLDHAPSRPNTPNTSLSLFCLFGSFLLPFHAVDDGSLPVSDELIEYFELIGVV